MSTAAIVGLASVRLPIATFHSPSNVTFMIAKFIQDFVLVSCDGTSFHSMISTRQSIDLFGDMSHLSSYISSIVASSNRDCGSLLMT
jgi:hypothetical protein